MVRSCLHRRALAGRRARLVVGSGSLGALIGQQPAVAPRLRADGDGRLCNLSRSARAREQALVREGERAFRGRVARDPGRWAPCAYPRIRHGRCSKRTCSVSWLTAWRGSITSEPRRQIGLPADHAVHCMVAVGRLG